MSKSLKRRAFVAVAAFSLMASIYGGFTMDASAASKSLVKHSGYTWCRSCT